LFTNKHNKNNSLQGTDGLHFHPLIDEGDKLWIFKPETCRSTWYEMDEKGERDDVQFYRFVPAPDAGDISRTDILGEKSLHFALNNNALVNRLLHGGRTASKVGQMRRSHWNFAQS